MASANLFVPLELTRLSSRGSLPGAAGEGERGVRPDHKAGKTSGGARIQPLMAFLSCSEKK